MFNTAKNTIKKAAKDQVEFVGAILTGVFVGSIFTLAYEKPLLSWAYQATSTIYDWNYSTIGSMLAGVGTMGLLVVGLSWKKQIRYQNNLKAFSECYIRALSFNRYMKDVVVSSLSNYSYYKEEFNQSKTRDRELTAQIEATTDLSAKKVLIDEKKENQKIISNCRDQWSYHRAEYMKAYTESQKQKDSLENAEGILLPFVDRVQKDQILQLSDYFNFNGKRVGVHALIQYEHQFMNSVDDKKKEINIFYNESVKQLF